MSKLQALRYSEKNGEILLNGSQVLIRLLLVQAWRDAQAGRNTRGFLTGYRGSPVGGVDQAAWQAKEFLDNAGVLFNPAVNEDLGVTACWGTQQVAINPGAQTEGVFSMWYAKGPGVDRAGDALRHANASGTAPLGGVLAIAGDDHNAKSSTIPNQTEHLFESVCIPVLAPSDLQDYLDFGIHGWAISRFTGLWVAMKALADTLELTGIVSADPFKLNCTLPEFAFPQGGISIRWPENKFEQERLLWEYKIPALHAYARANEIDTIKGAPVNGKKKKYGIVVAGKAYLDTLDALEDLGVTVGNFICFYGKQSFPYNKVTPNGGGAICVQGRYPRNKPGLACLVLPLEDIARQGFSHCPNSPPQLQDEVS